MLPPMKDAIDSISKIIDSGKYDIYMPLQAHGTILNLYLINEFG